MCRAAGPRRLPSRDYDEMTRLLLLLTAAAALVGAAASRPDGADSAQAKTGPMLGFSFRTAGGTLAWFDPPTLEPLPGRKAPLARHWGSWAFSADRAVLATAGCDAPGIRLVNARRMKVLGDVRLSPAGECSEALTWLRPDRLLAVVETGTESTLVVVDPRSRRVLRREPLDGQVRATGRAAEALVLVLSEYGRIGPMRLAVVDADGVVRTVTLDRIVGGTVVGEEGPDSSARTVEPGLAVDPDGARAFLVPAAGSLAEVDLTTLALRYHDLSEPVSLLGALRRWLSPSAQAKEIDGPTRFARWLGDGLIAVTGTDYSTTTDAAGKRRLLGRAVGLRVIDTHSWTARTLNRDASAFVLAGDLVVAEGGSIDSARDQQVGVGLVAYGLDGRERWRLHSGAQVWLNPAGAVGYVSADQSRVEVVDLASGTVVRTLGGNDGKQWPLLLAGPASEY